MRSRSVVPVVVALAGIAAIAFAGDRIRDRSQPRLASALLARLGVI